jgi:hypothetical protein
VSGCLLLAVEAECEPPFTKVFVESLKRIVNIDTPDTIDLPPLLQIGHQIELIPPNLPYNHLMKILQRTISIFQFLLVLDRVLFRAIVRFEVGLVVGLELEEEEGAEQFVLVLD